MCVILRSCVYGLCVLIKDIGRRLSVELQCSYQGQQGDVSLCAETIKPVFEGDKNLTAVEGNASVYQSNPVSRITGEGRAEFLGTWGPGFDQEGAGGGRGGKSICAWKL